MKVFVFAFLWVHLTVLTVSCNWNDISLDGGRMLISWSYDAETDKLNLQINASTVGWIGFGFALFAPNGMQDYDVILAGYKNGSGYIYDMYSRGPSPPPLDSSQDYKLLGAIEEEGHTILNVERPGDTGDAKDIQFMNNTEVFLVWALHSSLDAINSSIYPFHDLRGSSKAKHFLGRVSSIQSKETSFGTMPVPVPVGSTSISKNTPNSATTLNQDTAPQETPMSHKASVGDSVTETQANIEVRSTVLSSTEQTTWNQNSSEEKESSAGATLTPSPSSSTDSGSSSYTPTTPLASSGKGKDTEQGTGFTHDGGKFHMNWRHDLLLIASGLFVIIIGFFSFWKVRAKHHRISRHNKSNKLPAFIGACTDVEIITKISEGRALCGIYHSEVELPKPAELKLIEVPRKVILQNAHNAQEMMYKSFFKEGFASACVKNVSESSSLVSLSMSGVDGLLDAKFKGAFRKQHQHEKSDQASSETASALHYFKIDKKIFQFSPDQLRINSTAQREAVSISSEAAARNFLDRYGSHYPEGVQTLGGVFFSIVDAESERRTNTTKLQKAALHHLKCKMAGFPTGAFGVDASAEFEHDHVVGENTINIDESSETKFTLSMKSIGPQAHNPATFEELLSDSSNWALTDRGNPKSYRPVWELLNTRNCGEEFARAAQFLKTTWEKDEKERCEERDKREAEEDLKLIMDKHLEYEHRDRVVNIRPERKTLTSCNDPVMTTREKAYKQATEFIIRNPQLHFCEIDLKKRIPWPFRNNERRYIIRCWEASPGTPVSFCQCKKGPVLFFSEKHFIWKNKIPGHG